jgi:hypothetical protein
MKVRRFARPLTAALLLGIAVPFALANIVPLLPTLGWPTFGHGPEHQGLSSNAAQNLVSIKWQTPVDLNPQYSGSVLYAHYGCPLSTARNTIVLPVKTGATDGFKVEGRRGSNGNLMWTVNTDYSVPSHNWFPECGPTLLPGNEVMIPAAGGTVLRRTNADLIAGTTTRLCFYGLSNYNSAQSTYNSRVKIDTPIVSDYEGNVYFGFRVSGTNPLNLVSGVARISHSGVGSWTSAATASGDALANYVQHNCAPALSLDGSVLYFAAKNSSGSTLGYLCGINSTTLAPLYKIKLKDPQTNNNARVTDDSTSSPCVGPDGDVYFGVLENPGGSNHSRGWMLHFNSTLTQTKIPGDFGWDHTPTIVPASIVPSYTGNSPYLLFTKYNDYYGGGGGIGLNKIAVLDPRVSQLDPVTGATVMKEIMTKLGPTLDSNAPPPAVREWCINNAAVDPFTKCALANCEDGKLYRWDFPSNTLSQTVVLTPGLGEAYTPTIVGMDGKVYAINNAILFAVGQ